MRMAFKRKGINSKAKGNRNEKKARNILEAEGYICEKQNYTRHGNKDLFNLWDLVAVKGGKTRWVQVKTNRLPSPAYRQLLKDFQGCGTKELWVFYDGNPLPRIIIL